jgi:NAD(P)-dependent dehydrogenase (short-subunit alcohol dehydrogenase family)
LKTVLITGAAAGLGRELALCFVARDVAVAAIDRDGAGLAEMESIAKGIRPDAKVATAILDLVDDGAPQRAVDAVVNRWGQLDIVVNNAAIGAIEPFFQMTAELWDTTLAINVRALALLTMSAGRAMVARRSGRIINITSPASRMAIPNYAAYAASKAAVDSITRAAAVALAPQGISVNSVAPGMMDTEMQRLTEESLARVEGRDDVQAFLDERTRRVPFGRRAFIEEIAASIVWLALDAPDYVVAERLNVSGGLDRD